jgi:predicted Rossmann fold flavoprotein
MADRLSSCHVAIVGGGAAGLAAAIFTRRENPRLDVAVLDGAAKPGAKILVSGGGRCNVTNAVVTADDFWGGRRTIIRRVLQALPVDETVEFFRGLGVTLHEEAGGKLFPDSNRARDVLNALLRGAENEGVRVLSGVRVARVEKAAGGFVLETPGGEITARAVVLATGGRSLPKTGSDGGGYELARALGHTLIPQTPALAPLVLDGSDVGGVHSRLSGVAVDAEIAVWIDGRVALRLAGALLWTHFGVSGPLALNVSRHWARARVEGRDVRLTLNFYPGSGFERVDQQWIAAGSARPRAAVRGALAASLPDAVAQAILAAVQIPIDRVVGELTRDERRKLAHALTEWPLPVVDTRGYNYAEATAGGVDLTEVDPSSMASRLCPGLFLVGEILDVDGRIGGFNFQWAWASGRAAARGLASLIP